MKIRIILAALIVIATQAQAITHSNIWIPPTLSGTTFDLNLHVTNKYFLPGSNTITYAYNEVISGGRP